MARKETAAPRRELLLLRHAKSAWDTGARSDFDRPLKKRGRRDAPRMGRWLAERGWRPDLVVSSPAERARRTTLAVLEELDLDEDAVRWEPRLYGADLAALLELLAEIPADVSRALLVGHNPGLEDLLVRLCGNSLVNPGDGKLLPTCALARLDMPPDWGGLRPGAGRVLALLRPREVEAGSRDPA